MSNSGECGKVAQYRESSFWELEYCIVTSVLLGELIVAGIGLVFQIDIADAMESLFCDYVKYEHLRPFHDCQPMSLLRRKPVKI